MYLGRFMHFSQKVVGVTLNLANFAIFTGVSPILLKQYRSSTHQFEVKMVAASIIPPLERKSFHLFLLKHLNVDLKIENISVAMDMALSPT